MKFPTATVILVSAALAFVIWNQTREQPVPLDAGRLASMESRSVARGQLVDLVIEQMPRLCEEATGAASGSSEHQQCLESSAPREPSCRRAMADRFPAMISSEQIFRELSVTMMNCLVQQSRRLGE